MENKSGVLLTHISMMAAVTGVLLGIRPSDDGSHLLFLNQGFLVFDFIVYLLLALLCVRCQFHVDSTHLMQLQLKTVKDLIAERNYHETTESLQANNREVLDEVFRGEIYYRENLFKFCFRGLNFITFTLGAVMVFSFFDIDVFKAIQDFSLRLILCINAD